MATTTFSGPVVSINSFVVPITVTASLPTDAPAGTLYIITDNGAGDDETVLVMYNGSAWLTAAGAALS
jgi:hypothetical protein